MNADDRQVLRRKLLKKGQEIAEMLSALLSGQKDPSGMDQLDAKPGETPEERLRRYLAMVQSRLDAINAGEGAYGACERCGKPIPLVELLENPIADICTKCAATGSGT